MTNSIKQLVCKHKGHNWDTYSISTGYGSNEIEQAGYCLRCKEDTHGEYENQIIIKEKPVTKLLNWFKKDKSKNYKTRR